MSGPNYKSRRSRLLRAFKTVGIDGLLLSGESNVRYLTGFTGDSSWLYLSKADAVLLSDSRYETQIANECSGLEVDIRDARRPMSVAAADVVKKAKAGRLGFEADHLTVTQHAALSNKIESAELVSTSGLTERLREIKDKWELTQ
ncbi:MAG: aminopeptidase P family protein, partial [Fuerstiella sp.]|nr:aminopeptidase P family protein [Fuerstiella sp.]